MRTWRIDESLSGRHRCWLAKVEWSRAGREENPGLWSDALDRQREALQARFPDKNSLGADPLIQVAREAYEAYGVNPRRYPPASEALLRRVVIQGQAVPAINEMVDLNNLISLRTLCPVGSYDRDKVAGNVTFLRGHPEHRYSGIGGSEFVAENFPTFVDATGPFGGSSRDSLRTMVLPESRNIVTLLMMYADPKSHGIDQILRDSIEEAVNTGLTLEDYAWIEPPV